MAGGETRVFVYGTLRRGERGHHLLGGAELITEARTAPAYTMIDMGEYPALLRGGATAIVGEIYRVERSRMVILDEYEEVPDVYRRISVQIAGLEVELYVLPSHLAGSAPVIRSGDWLRR